MRKIFLSLILILGIHSNYAQNIKLNIYTSDIDNFWIAFDSIHRTNDEEKQLEIIKNYIWIEQQMD